MWYTWATQIFYVCLQVFNSRSSSAELDILKPYAGHHGPVHRRLNDTQQCQHKRYGNTTYSLHKAHSNQSHLSHFIDIHHKAAIIGEFDHNQRILNMKYQRVFNPMRTFSVLEPGGQAGGCKEDSGLRATVQESSRSRNCVVAANAGFFNSHTGQCLGNIVSDGVLVQDSGGIQNAHFGITKDGQLFTGYLSEMELLSVPFQQLIGGVIWLVRDGEIYVNESRDIECPDSQEAGTLDNFVDLVSARTAVGHDSEGRILMVQIDGKTYKRGINLRELAKLLKEIGFVNAINLDGGGSATCMLNDTIVNYPSDQCPNSTWDCAREVSTILCVHEADCSPYPHCSHHGECVSGLCRCHSPWSGDSCELLACPGDCSGHGQCLEGGCLCEPGWQGENCSLQCKQEKYGANCSLSCQCLNNATCDPESGVCHCPPGFTGAHCQSACAYGFYGDGCRRQCSCPGQCFCDPVTGACSNSSYSPGYELAGQCMVAAKIKMDNLVPDQSDLLLSSQAELDILQPYAGHHGPVHRRVRDTQQCQHKRYGNTTYSLHKAHSNQSHLSHIIDIHHKVSTVGEFYYNQRTLTMRYQRVFNPMRTFSVLEPGGQAGACKEDSGLRATVQESGRSRNCVVAANAGFFNTHTGQCLGNIVSDGLLVQDSGGIQNAHFGITKDGQLFTGYLSEIELVTLQFHQLIGGVIWLIRDGEIYVDESRNIECPDTQETGTLDRFIDVVSARTAVGHDSEGRILMVQMDGKTNKRGMDLREFAKVLKEIGFVNAINLDGGGSATSVLNDTLVSYPSDQCPNSTWNCAREVSTILCVHEANCSPYPHCSHHGECVSGLCRCHSPWSGDSCELLACPDDCSGHGQCLEGGCLCEPGWGGENCSLQCKQGKYGANCSLSCQCLNNATCDPESGVCHCPPGFTGAHCQSACAYGFYGDGCRRQCSCAGQCFCDPVTGACSNSSYSPGYQLAGQCMVASKIKRDNLVPDQSQQLLMWKWISVAAGMVAVTSIVINIWLTFMGRSSRRRPPRNRRHRAARSTASLLNHVSEKDSRELVPLRGGAGEEDLWTDSSDEPDEETSFFEKPPSQKLPGSR